MNKTFFSEKIISLLLLWLNVTVHLEAQIYRLVVDQAPADEETGTNQGGPGTGLKENSTDQEEPGTGRAEPGTSRWGAS